MRNTDLALWEFFKSLASLEPLEVASSQLMLQQEDVDLKIYKIITNLKIIGLTKLLHWCGEYVKSDIVTMNFHLTYLDDSQASFMDIRFKFKDARLFEDAWLRRGGNVLPLKTIVTHIEQKLHPEWNPRSS